MLGEHKEKKYNIVGNFIDPHLIEEALRSGNYKTKTIWTELYLRFRQENIYLYVRKELEDQYIKEVVQIIINLDYLVFNFNVKKAMGAYLLSLICVKPTNNFFVVNPNSSICYKKV